MSGTLQQIVRTSADARELMRQATVAAMRTFLGVPDAADGVWTRDELAGILKPYGGVQLDNNVSGQYIGIPFGRAQFGLRDFSFSVRRLPTPGVVTANTAWLFTTHRAATNNRLMAYWPDNNTFRLRFANGAGATTDIDIADSRYQEGHVITVTCDRSGNASLYYDGVLEGTASLAAVATIDIGAGNSGEGSIGHQSQRPIHALVQGIEIFNRALTPTEVGEIGRGGNLSGVDRSIDVENDLPLKAFDWTTASTDGLVDGNTALTVFQGGETVSDGSESKNDCLLVQINTATSQHGIWVASIPLVRNTRYRVFGWYLIKNGTGLDQIELFLTGTLKSVAVLAVVGSWTYFEAEFVANSPGFGARPRDSGAVAFPGTGTADDDTFALHGVQIERVGSLARFDPQHILGEVWFGHNGQRFDIAGNIVSGVSIPMAGPARLCMETGDPLAEVLSVKDSSGLRLSITEAGYLILNNVPVSADGSGLLNGQVYVDASGFLKLTPTP